MWENLKKLLGLPIILTLACLLIFNPYVFCVDSLFVSNSTVWINDFCSNLGLSYCFTDSDILGSFRFLEYFIFGMISITVFKIYFKGFHQNIVNSMFFGLLVAVLEAYYRSFGVYKLDIRDVLYSFLEVCIGVVVCICSSIKPKKRFLSKYRKNSYMGRG